MKVTITEYDETVYRPGTKSADGECTWGAPCSTPAGWTVLWETEEGRVSRWASRDRHRPDRES